MGLLEPITHREEIEQLCNDAQEKYDKAIHKFETQKKATTRNLENLGKVKIEAWANGIETFVEAFGSFKNVEVDKNIDTNMNFIHSDEEPNQMIINMQTASLTAGEIVKYGFAAVGTGAIVGVASYGGVIMFGAASTGTAIATLSGVAKTNATLAWFGGGSLKSGGSGVRGGKLVLAGIILAPILAVATIIAAAKGKERLAEAKKICAEAEEAAVKIDIITTELSGIATMAGNYAKFVNRFNRKFEPFINELRKIKEAHSEVNGEKIDFNALTTVEQKTLHLSWLMAQIYYHVLSTPILTDNGEVAPEASSTLEASNNEFEQIKRTTYKMVGEDAAVGNLIWAAPANRMIVINFAVMVILIICGCIFMADNIIHGIAYFACSLIAFPVFFKYKNLPASKLYFWRKIKLIASLGFVVLVEAVLRGGM